MFRSSGKPYTAVTVQVENLTSEQYEVEDVAGIYDLVEVIRLQSSGPTEAARALRKKLKYGNPHRQLRSLVLLDGLLENAGSRFQRTFVDEPLLERLRLLPREEVTDAQVRQKCQVLFVQWANSYQNISGLERIANLYKELPKSHRPAQARQKVLQDTERYDSDGEAPTPTGSRSRATSSATPAGRSSAPVTLSSTTHRSHGFSKLSKRSKSNQGKPFDLAREKDTMTTTIAQASIASTNLLNGLQLINRETQRVSENPEVVRRFETCKNLRRKILYYIQNVESDDWIGSLVNANDELVKALTAYEITDRSIDDDSDSDAWEHLDTDTANQTSAPTVESNTKQLAGLKMEAKPPVKPPRPGGIAMPPPPSLPNAQSGAQDTLGDGEDDNDPFGDANAAPTPHIERPGMTWKEPEIIVDSDEVETELGLDDFSTLQRVRTSYAPSSAARQDENAAPKRAEPYTGLGSSQPLKSRRKFWRGKSKQAQPEPDLHPVLVRTAATTGPLVPDPEEEREAQYWRVIDKTWGGQEPYHMKRRRTRPDLAEDLQRFTTPKFGETNPSVKIRIKRALASTLTAIVNPKTTTCRFGHFLFENFCGCCIEQPGSYHLAPFLMVKAPSDEEKRKERVRMPHRRASDAHASPRSSYLRSRENLAHLKKAGEINQSKQLLKPPETVRCKIPEDNVTYRDFAYDPQAIAQQPNGDRGQTAWQRRSSQRNHERATEDSASEATVAQTDGAATEPSQAEQGAAQHESDSGNEPTTLRAGHSPGSSKVIFELASSGSSGESENSKSGESEVLYSDGAQDANEPVDAATTITPDPLPGSSRVQFELASEPSSGSAGESDKSGSDKSEDLYRASDEDVGGEPHRVKAYMDLSRENSLEKE